MKDAREIIKSLGSRQDRLMFATNPSGMIAWIKQIQLDAWRAGMGSAKGIATEINDGHEWPVTRAIQKRMDEVKDLF